MKAVPNIITTFRIILSLCLMVIQPLSITFYVIYIICGLSDILDGFTARKLKAQSSFGSKLDSIADLVMICVLMFVLLPILKLSFEVIIWIILIASVRISSLAVGYLKYKIFSSIHTYANKITGFALFLFPILMAFFDFNILIIIICSLASISAIEELVIQLMSKQLDLNKKNIFNL